MKNNKTIEYLESLADYYWQASLYDSAEGDFYKQTLNREKADAYYKAAQIVKYGPGERKVSKITGEFADLKYGEIPKKSTTSD